MSLKVSPRIRTRTRTRLMLPVRDRNPVPHFAIAIQIFPSGCSLTDCQTSSWQLAAPHKLPVGCQVAWAAAPCHFHFDSDLILMDMLDANTTTRTTATTSKESNKKNMSRIAYFTVANKTNLTTLFIQPDRRVFIKTKCATHSCEKANKLHENRFNCHKGN